MKIRGAEGKGAAMYPDGQYVFSMQVAAALTLTLTLTLHLRQPEPRCSRPANPTPPLTPTPNPDLWQPDYGTNLLTY